VQSASAKHFAVTSAHLSQMQEQLGAGGVTARHAAFHADASPDASETAPPDPVVPPVPVIEPLWPPAPVVVLVPVVAVVAG
jgi:hypothetical protein